MFTRHELTLETRSATWLMPVVPPMVSAATGAALIAHLPAGQARLTLLLACYAMFGLSLRRLGRDHAVWARLASTTSGPRAIVPTLWIVLGPLGQSITAANLLGAARHPRPLRRLGVLYGVPVWGFAMLWLVIAAAITIRAARLPFSLTWWSFTFPVGTVVTGTSELALHTGAGLFRWAAAGLYLVLVAAWAVVSVRTVAGTWRGSLLRAAPPVPANVPRMR